MSANSNFPWRIFIRVVLAQSSIVLIALAFSGVGARFFFKQQFLSQIGTQLSDTLRSLSSDIVNPSRVWCTQHSKGTEFRFTLIAANGTVVCDSLQDSSQMENHKDRPEFVEALKSGFGHNIRHSATLDEEMVYGALRIDQAASAPVVLRGAIPLSRLSSALRTFDKSLILFLVIAGVVLSFFITWSGRTLLFPMGRILLKARGNLDQGVRTEGPEAYGEWQDLETSIEDIRRDLETQTERLDREREELTTLMGTISDAVLALDREGAPLFFNSRFALVFGESPNNLSERFQSSEVLQAFHAALHEGKPGSVRPIPVNVGGSKRFYAISVSPLRRRMGDVYGAVGIFHDVTDLKSAEQIRIDFVANVSHELRTPLTAIKGYTDTLISDAKASRPVDQEFLDIIARNVERLISLIGDLLDLSSLESSDVLHRSRISTQDITERVIRQLTHVFESKKQTIVQRLTCPFVYADPKRLEQVLVNLLDNASKYTPVGETIKVSWDEVENGDVILSVQDAGPGISPEHHVRLFERFYRVDKARSRELGGTGLGLAIVKHIMQRHEGMIWLESELGHGATFFCRFPTSRAVSA